MHNDKESIMATLSTKYTKTAIILHWLIGFGIVFMFLLGWYMCDLPKEAAKASNYDLFDLGIYTWQLSEEVSPRTFYFNLHKSIGITLLGFIAFRVFWRLTHPAPALIKTMKAWEKKLANATHHALYLIMVLLPLSGLTMALYSKYGVKWFGISLAEGLGNKGVRDFFKETHEAIGILLLILLVLHILAVIKHTFVNKDGTLKRMMFK